MPKSAPLESQLPATVQNQGLFSTHFLANRLPEPPWSTEALSAFDELRGRYAAAREIAGNWNEAQTENELIRPVLEKLGWHFIPQVPLIKGGKHNIPDYALFGDAAAKTQAIQLQKRPDDFFRLVLAIADAKYWGRPLDEELSEGVRAETSNANPGFQIINYLVSSDVAWGILTNGQVWRLYAQRVRSRTTTFYEINLEEMLRVGDRDAFRYFAFFFHRAAFQSDAATGQSFLERVMAESADYAVQVQDELKDLVFEKIVPLLVQGLVAWRQVEDGRRVETPETLAGLYQATLTLLYRLLFLLYAEARDLLPVRAERGYYQVSFAHLRREVAERKDRGITLAERSTSLWDGLTNLFRIVARGDSSLNVPIYNGGLFKEKPANGEIALSTLKIADAYLGEAIDLLTRRDDSISGHRVFIDYKDLDVRHLGSIYEGLLEFQARIAAEDLAVRKEKEHEVWVSAGSSPVRVRKGEVYLVNDRGQRKASGSYYTPDYIVKYIVANALSPIIDERQARFEEKMKRVAAVRRKLARAANPAINRTLRAQLAELEDEAVAALLDLKVCDPAMGSGHFLVETVGYLTDRFASLLAEYPANPLITLIKRVRGQILENLLEQGLQPETAQLDDKHLLKRMVMKRCVYGVDLNRMAVELAKLSLWLDSFTIGAPLSFLDHHLKWGNSLIGARTQEVERSLSVVETKVRGVQKRRVSIGYQGDLFGGAFAGLLSAAGLMRDVVLLTDATFEEVEQSGEKYAAFEKEILPYKRLLDLWVSRRFGLEKADEFIRLYGNQALKAVVDETMRLSPEHSHALALSRSLWQSKRFFHWDLEFPEVFIDLDHSDWMNNPGFDAVIGNPPYDELSEEAWGREIDEMPYFQSAAHLLPALGHRVNLYRLFVAQAITLTRESGWQSFIVPLSLLADQFSLSLRKFLLETVQFERIEQFPQKDDAHDRVFLDAKLSTCLYVLQKIQPANKRVFIRSHPGRDILENSPSYTASQSDFTKFDQENLSIPGLSQLSWDLILRLALNKKYTRLGEYAEALPGELMINSQFDPYLTNAIKGEEIIRGSHIAMYELVEPKQGEPLYLNRKKYLLERSHGEKASHYKHERIVYQRYAAIDNYRRLIATLLPAGYFCSHTVGYLARVKEYELEFLLALLNSTLLDWRFNLTSTNNNINGYEVEALPVPRIVFSTSIGKRTQLLNKALRLAKQAVDSGEFGGLLDFVRERLAQNPEQADVLHDLLAHLARQMIEMNAVKQKETREFFKWLDTYTGLTVDEWKLKTIVQDYARNSWEEFQRALRANAKAFTRDIESRAAVNKLQSEWEKSVDKLRPLWRQIETTDKLIDHVVYALYGISDVEINIVEGK